MSHFLYHNYTICNLKPLELKEQSKEALENNKNISNEVRKSHKPKGNTTRE